MKDTIYEKYFGENIARIILDNKDMSFDIEYKGNIIEHHDEKTWKNITGEEWTLEMFVEFAGENWELENSCDDEFTKALEMMDQ